MTSELSEPNGIVIAETDDFLAYQVKEPDGETVYYLTYGNLTIQFFQEEWDEFLILARTILKLN